MNTAELIRKIANKNKTTVVRAIVKSVDEEKGVCDCQLLGSGADIYDVKINAAINTTKGIRIIPSIDSVVYLIFEDNTNTEAFIALYSEVEKVLLDGENFQFNSGENGGLIRIEDLITKINIIENDINSLKSVFSNWITSPNDGGASLKAASASWFSQNITKTKKEDIENNKIKH